MFQFSSPSFTICITSRYNHGKGKNSKLNIFYWGLTPVPQTPVKIVKKVTNNNTT